MSEQPTLADIGEESQRYDGGLLYGPPSPTQRVIRAAIPDCRCHHHWWTSYRGHRSDGSCIRCGGAT